MSTTVLTPGQSRLLLAVAEAIVPESIELEERERGDFLALIESALAARPPALRRQFGLFLAAIRWLPLLRYGAPMDALPANRRDRALRWFQDSPVPIVRKGFWGLKTLVFMGYYGRVEAGERIGYRPSKDSRAILKALAREHERGSS